MTAGLNYKTPTRIITAFIDPSAIIGDDSTVWHYARILAGVRIGRGCSIGGGAEIGRDTIIGDDSRISAGVFLPPNTKVGKHVFIGPNVTCTDDMHPKVPRPGDAPYDAQPPIIEDYAAIGAGAVLVPGVRIGYGARVAAGAIVTKSVPDRAMVRGQPARFRLMPPQWEHVAEVAAVSNE